MGAHLERLTLTGSANIKGYGNAGNNLLKGNRGHNTLDGGAGADRMEGGQGNDHYHVDHKNDKVIEKANEGIDTVFAGVDYRLGAHLERLTLTGSANIKGYGNAGNNLLKGNRGHNTLDGGAGTDRMEGGQGNDHYHVDHKNDRVIEKANEGIDTVFAGVDYRLGDHLERLTLTGSANLKGYGNAGNNLLKGNSGHNTLDGGAGADRMEGGKGNDRYYVDHKNDRVIEKANEGIDTVFAGVDYHLGDHLERLTLTGNANLKGYGNAGHNILTGNEGNDVLQGGAGNDLYIVNNTDDLVLEFADEGIDTVRAGISYALSAHVEHLILTGADNITATGNDDTNVLLGNDGNNVLSGKDGNDQLYGGLGNDILMGGYGQDLMEGGDGDDTYYVDHEHDEVIEEADSGKDLVYTDISYTLAPHLDCVVTKNC